MGPLALWNRNGTKFWEQAWAGYEKKWTRRNTKFKCAMDCNVSFKSKNPPPPPPLPLPTIKIKNYDLELLFYTLHAPDTHCQESLRSNHVIPSWPHYAAASSCHQFLNWTLWLHLHLWSMVPAGQRPYQSKCHCHWKAIPTPNPTLQHSVRCSSVAFFLISGP